MTRRYLTAQSRLWRLGTLPLALLGVVLMAWFAWMWMDDANASIWNLVPVSIFSLMLFLPSIVAFMKKEYLEVDLSARTSAFHSKGKVLWQCPLDELGPLGFKQGHRESTEQNGIGTTYFHVMCRGAHQLVIRETYSYESARKYATKLAREWNVGLATMDGQFHPPTQGDQMLRPHKRDAAPAPKLSAKSGITIERDGDVTVVRSTNRLRAQEFPNTLLLGGVAMGFVALGDLRVGNILETPMGDPGRTFMAVVAALLMLVCGGIFLVQLWRYLSPPTTITIGAGFVRHRGRSIPLVDVQEVTYITGPVILSARKKIEIDRAFCKTSESPAFIAELRRLITDAADEARSSGPPV